MKYIALFASVLVGACLSGCSSGGDQSAVGVVADATDSESIASTAGQLPPGSLDARYQEAARTLFRSRAISAAQYGLASGDRFDLAAFHDLLLLGVAMPMTILEREVDRWVAGQG